MPRVAITGHMNLTADSLPLVRKAIDAELASYTGQELIGLSCIARGADSLFACAVLDHGGELQVFLPAAGYRETKVKPNHAAQFDDLIEKASSVHVMPFEVADRVAYEATNAQLLANCDHLLAVWDGQPSGDKGGTASVVQDARTRGVPVTVVWPGGAAREA